MGFHLDVDFGAPASFPTYISSLGLTAQRRRRPYERAEDVVQSRRTAQSKSRRSCGLRCKDVNFRGQPSQGLLQGPRGQVLVSQWPPWVSAGSHVLVLTSGPADKTWGRGEELRRMMKPVRKGKREGRKMGVGQGRGRMCPGGASGLPGQGQSSRLPGFEPGQGGGSRA